MGALCGLSPSPVQGEFGEGEVLGFQEVRDRTVAGKEVARAGRWKRYAQVELCSELVSDLGCDLGHNGIG